ncbi:MAG: hypothetical protein PHW87_03555 [Methanothrix sp.]|nr:hypothetical protein [Methanothrix sp.]
MVRIDAHHDMFQCCPALPARERRGKFEFIERLLPLCRNTHAIASMIETSPVRPFTAMSLGPLYHFHPAKNRIDAYGRVSRSETADA